MCYIRRGYPFWEQKKLCKHSQKWKVESSGGGRINNQLNKIGKMVMRSFMFSKEGLSRIVQGFVLELGHGWWNKNLQFDLDVLQNDAKTQKRICPLNKSCKN